MKYVNLGKSGLKVSEICLGCMSFGTADKFPFHKWVLDEEESHKIIKHALDLGINFFDTANVYSMGDSEIILGNAIKKYANREDVVLASKVGVKTTEEPNIGGLSRKNIMREIDKTLTNLQTDYLDLYIIHRWDHDTPIEETMKALHDLVVSNKVRYIGASSMYAWQFAKAQEVARKNNWTEFISMQDHMNLIYREDERDMEPLCLDQGVGLTPYSPLASGRLAREIGQTSKRYETDTTAVSKYDSTKDIDEVIIRKVSQLAKEKNVTMSEVSLAWLRQKESVSSIIIGATKAKYIDDAINSTNLELSPDEIEYLQEDYMPHDIVGPIKNK